MDIKKLIRPHLANLKPYSNARSESNGAASIRLDANENPFGTLNRYPDPFQSQLKKKLSELKQIDINQIFLGNGSDEVIDLALRVFCIPGKDKIIVCPPTYGMYEVSANIHDVKIEEIPLTSDFQLNIDKIIQSDAKLVFICSPNNPTGNNLQNIETLLQNFRGIVFVDEAYIDFSSEPSWVTKLNLYQNLIVSQTFSKAWGKAAIRVGMAYANAEVLSYFNIIKPPYNVSERNQQDALEALNKMSEIQENIGILKTERNWLQEQLQRLPIVDRVYPSEANFILIQSKQAKRIYNLLLEQGIVIRNRESALEGGLRISVGTPEENKALMEALKNIA